MTTDKSHSRHESMFKEVRALIGVKCNSCGVYDGPLACDKCEKTDGMTLKMAANDAADTSVTCACGEDFARCECESCGKYIEGEGLIALTEENLSRHMKMASHALQVEVGKSFLALAKKIEWTSPELGELAKKSGSLEGALWKTFLGFSLVVLGWQGFMSWSAGEQAKKRLSQCMVAEVQNLVSSMAPEAAVIAGYQACMTACKVQKWVDDSTTCEKTFSDAGKEIVADMKKAR